MRMTVQRKLILLVYGLAAVCIIGLIFFRFSQNRTLAPLYESFGKSYDDAVAEKSAPLLSFVNEYSYWDDLVAFTAKKRSSAWAARTFNPCLTEYKATAIWVYTTDFMPAYAAVPSRDQNLAAGLLPAAALRTAFAAGNIVHFYVEQPSGIMEVVGASIHPTADSARTTPPQGYLLAARRWDSPYLDLLAKASGMRVAVIDRNGYIPESVKAKGKDTVVVQRQLAGWNGKPVASVALAAESAVLKNAERSMRRQLYFAAGAAFVLIALIYGLLLYWIAIPLNLLYAGLDAENMASAEKLLSDKSEFGYIAQLVARIFEQKSHLLSIQTSLTEEKELLERKVNELSAELEPLKETMCQVTINREETERLTLEAASLRQAEAIIKNAYAGLERKLKESTARLHVVSELLQREILSEHEHREAEMLAIHARQEAEEELAHLKFQLEQRTAELHAANQLVGHDMTAAKKITDKKNDMPEIKFEARC